MEHVQHVCFTGDAWRYRRTAPIHVLHCLYTTTTGALPTNLCDEIAPLHKMAYKTLGREAVAIIQTQNIWNVLSYTVAILSKSMITYHLVLQTLLCRSTMGFRIQVCGAYSGTVNTQEPARCSSSCFTSAFILRYPTWTRTGHFSFYGSAIR